MYVAQLKQLLSCMQESMTFIKIYFLLQVLKGLYLGNLYDSRNPEALEGNSITHILSIYDMARPHFQGTYSYLCVDVSDSSSQPITQVFGECIEFIHRARADGGRQLQISFYSNKENTTLTCK